MFVKILSMQIKISNTPLLFRCYIPGCDDPIYPEYKHEWVKYTVPGEYSSGIFKPEQCLRYLVNNSYTSTFCEPNGFIKEVESCNRWVFDKEKTIVNEVYQIDIDNFVSLW